MYITRIQELLKVLDFGQAQTRGDRQDTRCHYHCDDCGQGAQENTLRRKYCLIWKFHLHHIYIKIFLCHGYIS